MHKTLQFSVDSALLRELGEKLVESVHLALSELVKNAYDADATEVEVAFESTDHGLNRIKIIDNGTGMNFSAIQKYWMRIATSNKDRDDVSKVYGRPLTGAKGIGRFSCRRLGNKLTLITKGTIDGDKVGYQKDIQKTEVVFPWTKFEAGTDVTEIECPGEQTEIEGAYTGTTLIIDDISDEWSKRGFDWLMRQLAVLTANQGVKRDRFERDPGFDVLLSAPNLEGKVRDLREDLIDAGWGTLKATLNKRRQAVCELDALGIGHREIMSNEIFPALEDINLKIGLMVDDRDQMRDTSVISKGSLKSILDNWGGVQIKYRGFRVAPYGNDDWLRIDRDRGLRKLTPNNELVGFASSLRGIDPSRSLINALSMRSYVGSVEIGSESSGFEMKASREGFIDSPEMDQLRKFVRFAIDWANILREYYLRQKNLKAADKARRELEDLSNKKVESKKVVDTALSYLESEVRTKTFDFLPREVKREVETSLETATNAIKTYNESVKVELSHLRLIASTSTLLLIFSHEVKSLLGLFEQSKNSLQLVAEKLSGVERNSVLKMSKDFGELNGRLEQLLQMTNLLSSTGRTKPKPGRVALNSKIKKVEKVFELVIQKYGIEINYEDVPKNIVLQNFLEAELYSILLNVMSNSIKAVIAKGGDKKIRFSARMVDAVTEIVIQDSGIGINPEKFEEVFIPFISDPEGSIYHNLETKLNPEDYIIVGTGSGLGLGIVNEIVKAKGGSVEFKEPESDWATQLEIKLP